MSQSPPDNIDDKFQKIILRFSKKRSDEIAMTAHQVDALIAALRQMRRRLEPSPAAGRADAAAGGIVSNPRWVCRRLGQGKVLLQIRSPAFGWLGFELPPPEAAKLGRGLVRYAAGTADSTRAGKRPKTAREAKRRWLN
jgi:hypothetical protein